MFGSFQVSSSSYHEMEKHIAHPSRKLSSRRKQDRSFHVSTCENLSMRRSQIALIYGVVKIGKQLLIRLLYLFILK
jgi:hypothetical protein